MSNGSLVRAGRRLESSPSDVDELAWLVGDMSSARPAGASLVAPAYLLAGRTGLYVEAAGLRVGELGALLLSELTNTSSSSWLRELTLDAALLYPLGVPDSGGPSLFVRLSFPELVMVPRALGLLNVSVSAELAAGRPRDSDGSAAEDGSLARRVSTALERCATARCSNLVIGLACRPQR